jgi:hypothetical protein
MLVGRVGKYKGALDLRQAMHETSRSKLSSYTQQSGLLDDFA